MRKASYKASNKLKRSNSVDSRRKSSSNVVVPRLLKPEAKYFDYATTGGITGGTPGVFYISGIQTGTDVTDRIGRKIQWKNLRVRFSVYQSTTASIATVRMLVVCDRNNTGSLPNATDIIANSSSSETASNFANRDRFQVLIDEYLPNVGNQNDHCGIVDRFVKIRGPTTQFVSTGSSVASAGAGAIFLLLMSDQTISAAAGTGDTRSGYSIWTRVGFYDA